MKKIIIPFAILFFFTPVFVNAQAIDRFQSYQDDFFWFQDIIIRSTSTQFFSGEVSLGWQDVYTIAEAESYEDNFYNTENIYFEGLYPNITFTCGSGTGGVKNFYKYYPEYTGFTGIFQYANNPIAEWNNRGCDSSNGQYFGYSRVITEGSILDENAADTLLVAQFYNNNGTAEIVDLPMGEYIDITYPTNGTVSASSSIFVTVEYGGSGTYDIVYQAQKYGIGDLETLTATTSTTISGTGAETAFLVDHGNATSTWQATARITNVFTGETIYSDEVIYHIFATSSEYTDRFATYEDIPCSVSDLTGCFKKALYWAFIPQSSITNDFLQLWEEIKTKKPIGYVTAITDQISEISNGTATSTYALGIPDGLQTTFFDPIRNIVILPALGLLGLFFMLHKLGKMSV